MNVNVLAVDLGKELAKEAVVHLGDRLHLNDLSHVTAHAALRIMLHDLLVDAGGLHQLGLKKETQEVFASLIRLQMQFTSHMNYSKRLCRMQ